MTILLNPETEKLLEERMKRGGYSTFDEAIRVALLTLESSEGEPIEALDPETQASIKRGLEQAARGETRPWTDVKSELEARFNLK